MSNDAKCRWHSDRLDGAVSFRELLGHKRVRQIRQGETLSHQVAITLEVCCSSAQFIDSNITWSHLSKNEHKFVYTVHTQNWYSTTKVMQLNKAKETPRTWIRQNCMSLNYAQMLLLIYITCHAKGSKISFL